MIRTVHVEEITKNIKEMCIEAVSYTHLDVYKRQVESCTP